MPKPNPRTSADLGPHDIVNVLLPDGTQLTGEIVQMPDHAGVQQHQSGDSYWVRSPSGTELFPRHKIGLVRKFNPHAAAHANKRRR